MAHYYRDAVADDPSRPAHRDAHGADPENYREHLHQDHAIIASRVRIPGYEELAEEADSGVEVLAEEDVDTGRYPVPDVPEDTEPEPEPADENDAEDEGEE